MLMEIIGYLGMTMTLSSIVAANCTGVFRKWFNPLVISGGICLTINAISIGSIPFTILNFVFSCIGVWGLIKERRK